MSDQPPRKERRMRARGKPQQQEGQMPPPRPGVSPAADSAPTPPLKPTPRGRAVITVPVAPARPSPIEEVTKKMETASLSEGQGPSSEPIRGRREPVKPTRLVTKPAEISTKIGTYGKPLILTSNFFAFESLTAFTLYQYRVDFSPDEERLIVRKAYLRQHRELLGAHIFDGTVLYMLHMLPKDPTELLVQDKVTNDTVKIIIKKTTDCVPGDHHYLQVWSIIFRKCLESMKLQLVGRDYYDAAAKVVLKEYNLEVWPGYVSSIRQHEHQILLNVDVSSKIMRNDTALDLLNECRQRSGENYGEVFSDAIIHTTVITRYNNATYHVDDVDYNSTPRSTFDMKGEKVSYVDYYKKKYNLNIRDLNQPLLVSKPKAKDIRGGRDKLTMLVPELCCLTGITDSMRSNFQLMRSLADHTRVKPGIRIQRLERGFMHRLSSTPESQEELKKWNIKFCPNLLTFEGRTFPPEIIVHGNNRESEADYEADFTKNLRRQRMIAYGSMRTWVFIYPAKLYQDVTTFCGYLIDAAKSLGFEIPEPEWVEIKDDRSNTYADAIEKSVQQYQPLLVLSVLMNNKGDRYEAIKKKCYVDRAIPSQCVLAKNLASKGVMSICTKIAIQINCKLGGIPWSVKIPFKTPVMITGFDVTHDTKVKGKSVGAFVATINASYSRYFSAVSMHKDGEELSNDIAKQMSKAIIAFKRVNNDQAPSRIIMYRDGVGDGNIHHVLNHELELIKKEISRYYEGGVLPKICLILVSKKINARVIAGTANPPPGTIVDDHITMPERYDFYLVSQSVRQGTVSPTYYNVIYDNTGQSPDTTQRLTYKLTHMYFNWSGTVSVPAPVQYAHKLAFLIGQSVHRAPNPGLETLLYFL